MSAWRRITPRAWRAKSDTPPEKEIRVPDDRYAGRPFLRFVDAYILWLIEELDPATDAKLQEGTHRLASTFGSQAQTWQGIVREQLDFGEEDDARVRASWQDQLRHDDAIGQMNNPLAWSHRLSDLVTGA